MGRRTSTKKKLSTGAKVGIAVGSVAGAAVLTAAVVLLYKRSQISGFMDENEPATGPKTLDDLKPETMFAIIDQLDTPDQRLAFAATSQYNRHVYLEWRRSNRAREPQIDAMTPSQRWTYSRKSLDNQRAMELWVIRFIRLVEPDFNNLTDGEIITRERWVCAFMRMLDTDVEDPDDVASRRAAVTYLLHLRLAQIGIIYYFLSIHPDLAMELFGNSAWGLQMLILQISDDLKTSTVKMDVDIVHLGCYNFILRFSGILAYQIRATSILMSSTLANVTRTSPPPERNDVSHWKFHDPNDDGGMTPVDVFISQFIERAFAEKNWPLAYQALSQQFWDTVFSAFIEEEDVHYNLIAPLLPAPVPGMPERIIRRLRIITQDGWHF
jgi:hypothetical protein